MLTHGSLFAGYGGLDIAIADVFGARTAWLAEFEDAPARVLAHHYPDAPNLGDVTRVDWATVPRVDIISGGYPCQPFSQAGRRLGQDDDRHLWPYVRDAIAVLRPPMVMFENVRGHLTLGFDEVVRDLHQLGYDVEWVLVKASDLGACHQRARLFILGVNRERRVRSGFDRWGRLDRHQQDGSQHVCDPCPGGDGHEGHAHPALHEGRVRRQDREASGGDGAARREGRLGRGWAGGCGVLGGDQAASDPQERAGRVCAGPLGFDPRVAESVRAQALDRRTPSPCPPPHAQGAGIECAWAGSAGAGTAEGSRTDRPVPLGRVVGDGGEPVWPDTIHGKLPDEWEHDRGAPVRCAPAGLLADSGHAANSDRAGLQGLADPQGAAPAERHGHAVAGAGGHALALLPTPTVSDTNGPGQHGTGGADLRTTVALLPTPRATRGSSIGCGCSAWGHFAPTIHRQERAFGRVAPPPTEVGPSGKPRLSPRAVEWMMALPAGWVTDRDVTRNEALKMLGNGVVPPQAAHALRVMLGRLP